MTTLQLITTSAIDGRTLLVGLTLAGVLGALAHAARSARRGDPDDTRPEPPAGTRWCPDCGGSGDARPGSAWTDCGTCDGMGAVQLQVAA